MTMLRLHKHRAALGLPELRRQAMLQVLRRHARRYVRLMRTKLPVSKRPI
jgi:hypothetical protein